MSDSLPSEKKVAAWPEATLADRLYDCRVMLYVHGILTDAERERADQRIEKLIKEREKARG